jgi:hypothetical protein
MVTFGTGGGTYNVTVAAKAVAGCSDTLKLNVVEVKSETVSHTPADMTRTQIGVGEEVNMSLTPAVAGATWTASLGTCKPTSGSSTTYTAGDSTGSGVVTATLPIGSCTKTFTLIAPTTVIRATVAGTDSFAKGTQGAGVRMLPVIIGPDTVSFYRLQIMEVGKDASSISGYFTTHAPISHIGHGADNWFGLNESNAWQDHASLFGYPQPWAAGGFTWDIPAKWRIGATGAEHNMTGWNQVFSISGPNGTTTIRKFGHGVTRNTNDVSTTF